jgi:hypothetical protein
MSLSTLKTKSVFHLDWKQTFQGLIWCAVIIAAFALGFSYWDLKFAAELTLGLGIAFILFGMVGSFGRIEISRKGIVEKDLFSRREYKWNDIYSLYFVPGAQPRVEIMFKHEYTLENPHQSNPIKLAGLYGMEPKDFLLELETWWKESLRFKRPEIIEEKNQSI